VSGYRGLSFEKSLKAFSPSDDERIYTKKDIEAAIEATKAKYEKKFDEVFGELIEKINGGMSAAAAIRSMK
jgi:uncharacterized protein YtpQ (UPF0354 family)